MVALALVCGMVLFCYNSSAAHLLFWWACLMVAYYLAYHQIQSGMIGRFLNASVTRFLVTVFIGWFIYVEMYQT